MKTSRSAATAMAIWAILATTASPVFAMGGAAATGGNAVGNSNSQCDSSETEEVQDGRRVCCAKTFDGKGACRPYHHNNEPTSCAKPGYIDYLGGLPYCCSPNALTGEECLKMRN